MEHLDYVYLSYGVAGVVLASLLVSSLARYARVSRQLKHLEEPDEG